MRIFIAVKLTEKVRENLARSAEQLAAFATKGAFVPMENYHITLHFLGEVPQSDLIYVQSAMDGIKRLPAPRISVSQISVLRASDVVCAKYRYDEKLTDLHENLGTLLEKHGFSVEHRAYRPHTSLVRRYGFKMPFSEVSKNVAVYNMPFYADKIALYETVFRDGKPTYKELYCVTLPVEE